MSTTSPPVAPKEHYLKQIKKCVTFIYTQDADGGLIPQGTAFFVKMQLVGTKYDATYLVTAKHVLQDESEEKFLDRVFIRLNRRNDPTSDIFEMNLGDFKILTHSEDNVDIAVIPFPQQSDYEYKSIPVQLFISKDEANQKIIEGNRVFFAGMFANYTGTTKAHPIMRFGQVAMLPDEKIEVNQYGKPTKLAEIYLFECQSFSGNSGAPVFYEMPRLREDKTIFFEDPVIYFAGVNKGHYNDIRLKRVVDSINDYKLVQLHNGVAMVTPGHLLKEILDSEAAEENRKIHIKEFEASQTK